MRPSAAAHRVRLPDTDATRVAFVNVLCSLCVEGPWKHGKRRLRLHLGSPP
jgi:hypothetical protein